MPTVKRTASAEIFAAGEAIDTKKVIVSTHHSILVALSDLVIVVDPKDLFTVLYYQQQMIDKSIHSEVEMVRYESEARTILEIVWVPE